MSGNRKRRVLIASANPLFSKGLQKIYGEQWGQDAVEFSAASNMGETLAALQSWSPDMVILDYDDKAIHREEFLSHFISSEGPMQVVLLSLQESGEVVVYDRRTLTPAEASDWLASPQGGNTPFRDETPRQGEAIHPPTPPSRSGPMKGNTRHYLIAGGLVVLSTAILYFLLSRIGLLPAEASAQAVTIDQLFRAHFFLIALLFSLIVVFLVYSIVVFRSKPGEKQEGAYFKSNNKLEIIWTLIPLAIVIGFSFIGARNLAATREPEANALNVKVTAFQWAWAFEYTDYGVTSRELYLPVDRQVLLSLTSRDVIHSFWVPEFRVKQDILPGENFVKQLRINPTREGEYEMLCAELCGGSHAYMTAPVKVVSQAEFEQWLSTQVNATLDDPVERGQMWASVNGCISCHSLDGSKLVGPTWKGLAGEQVTLADGSTVIADDAYLRASILEPNTQITEGYPANVMPSTYSVLLTGEQIDDIVAYIKTVK